MLYFFLTGTAWRLAPSYADNRITQKDQVITIKGVTDEDEGLYRCLATKDDVPRPLKLGFLSIGGKFCSVLYNF